MKTWSLRFSCYLVLALGACGGDSGGSSESGDQKLTDDAIAKLKECKLYTSYDSKDADIEDDYDRCAARCVVAATCAGLKDLRCSDSPSATNATVKCVTACPEKPDDGFACSDNSKIPHAALCDGDENCSTGEDEKNCGSYNCTDGEKLPFSDVKCDGFSDCSDGSDEEGCPNVCG